VWLTAASSFPAGEATDIAWLASDPVLYDRLVRRRSWSMRRFEEWCAQSMIRQFIQTAS
jgi:hypothetical protein